MTRRPLRGAEDLARMLSRPRPHPQAWGVLTFSLALLAGVLSWAGASRAAAPPAPSRTPADLERRFAGTVKPFLQAYCVSCHGKNQPQAQLDLSAWTSMAAAKQSFPHLVLTLERLHAKEMPPAGSKQPTAVQRQAVEAWIRELRKYEAERNAGDPGLVLARRLSNAEYDYTIRDLTGQDLRPTREFPVDPANQEGFDNSGESLTVSPALMKKYLQAARQVADHVVLKPSGFAFAPHPVLADTDRDKYSILRIVDFYKRQPTDFADYFQAAWRYRHRAALGQPQATLASVAAGAKVSPRYLELVWNTLNGPAEKVGPIARLQEQWNALPAPGGADVRPACEKMRDWVTGLRKKVAWRFNNLRVPPGFSPGGQAFVLWKNRQYASHRRQLFTASLQPGGKPVPREVIPRRRGNPPPPNETVSDPVDPELFIPEEEAARAPYLAGFEKFSRVFPDAFYISERGRMFLDDPNDKGRLLSAGFHNQMGYFRDDTPLMELVLDEQGRQELDRLWLEFDFIAQVPERMHLEFIFYERAESGTIKSPEFDFARSEDRDATSDAKIRRLGDVYMAKAKTQLANSEREEPQVIQAIEEHFSGTSARIRAIEKARREAQPSHLEALLDFARRAYRRPLTPAEREGLVDFYRTAREKEGLSHEDAVRDGVTSVLMSPHFLYRLDLESADAGQSSVGSRQSAVVSKQASVVSKQPAVSSKRAAVAGKQASGGQEPAGVVRPLTGYEVASRLSYFLWSSMPDEELLKLAASGELQKPEVLAAQARRMLKDPRARALALEFGGNWLDFRRFEEHNAVDRERFPAFTDALREAMFQEPQRFLQDILQRDGSVLDLLYGKHTFVNAPLAKHYGMADVKPAAGEWIRVDNADRYGRGGLLPMAVFLTRNSPGLRTSPVKRGYWVVKRVLGEHIPPPPPTVPELPADEGKLGELTLRQALEKHRDHPACSGCHAKFDSYGLVFENYGPIGELRTKDLGGKAVDTRAPFPGGADRSGVTGLRDFVREKREADFLDNLSRKLLSYALGRGLLASDEPTLEQMRQRLTSSGYRVGTLVDLIVTSRQFRHRRVLAPGA